ncbi:MAG: alpha/beta fold hydrolase [Gammaproteobacteria bacterium]|nr:alpha/beta fold hydrolase [Gammaproteobacteria bacterium]
MIIMKFFIKRQVRESMTRLAIWIAGVVFLVGCASNQKIDPAISSDFNYTYKSFFLADNESISYVEDGKGDDMVFLHGIPSSSYLWRNVMTQLAPYAHTVAMDLPGYGHSSVPANNDYSYQALYERTEKFLLQFDRPITLVVNDLGSLLGLDYATRHPNRIKGIVLIEAAFMPSEQWYKQLLNKQKLMFWMLRNETIAKWMIVDKPLVQSMALNMGIVRSLSEQEKDTYMQVYSDVEKRKVLLLGPGPASIPKGMVKQSNMDMAATMNRIAKGLIHTQPQMLLLYADPGFIVQQEALDYAKTNFENVSLKHIGNGLHFLPEDQPTNISKAIINWYETLAKTL